MSCTINRFYLRIHVQQVHVYNNINIISTYRWLRIK